MDCAVHVRVIFFFFSFCAHPALTHCNSVTGDSGGSEIPRPQGPGTRDPEEQRRHTDPTPKPGLLQPRQPPEPVQSAPGDIQDGPPATGRRTLPPASLRAPGTPGTLQPPRSLRPQRHPGRAPTRSNSQPTAGPGLDGTGRGRRRGGAVTRPRAGGRASGRSAAAEVRRPPCRAAPLGQFRESGGERGLRPGGPDDLSFVTSCRPAVSGGNEKPGFVIGFSSFPLCGNRSPTPRRHCVPRVWRDPSAARCSAAVRLSARRGPGRRGREAAGSGPRAPRLLRGGAVSGCLRVLLGRSWLAGFSVSSSSRLRGRGDCSLASLLEWLGCF